MSLSLTLAIDPGTRESGWVLYDPREPKHPLREFAKEPNPIIFKRLIEGYFSRREQYPDIVIEHFVSYGRILADDSLETICWATRFETAAWFTTGHVPHLVTRRWVKSYICDDHRANDAAIRRALTERFGPDRKRAVGMKANPGPLYGLKADCWQALAVAITYCETGKSIRTTFVPQPGDRQCLGR